MYAQGELIMNTKKYRLMIVVIMAFRMILACGMWDASVAAFPRLPGESGDSLRIMRAVKHAERGGILWFPRGDYEIDSMIVVSNQVSFLMHKSARLKAVAKMPFVLKYFGGMMENGVGYTVVPDDHNLFIKGGDIDGNGLAGCAHIMGVRHFTMANTTFRNGKDVGLQLGDPSFPRSIEGGYEIVANNLYFICNKSGLAGNVGLLTYIGDSHFTDIVVVDYTTGIRDMKWSNRYTRCHIWGGTVKKVGTDSPEMLENSVAFDMRGCDSVLTDCYADTAMTGFLIKDDTRVFNCGYFNNWRFKMDNPTVFRHEAGRMIVTGGRFSKLSPSSVLYSSGKKAGELVWHDNFLIGFSEKDTEELMLKLGSIQKCGGVAKNLADDGQ